MSEMVMCSDGRMRKRGYYVRGYYNAEVLAPKQPEHMACEVWCANEYVRDLEITVFEDRPDIGRVEWIKV